MIVLLFPRLLEQPSVRAAFMVRRRLVRSNWVFGFITVAWIHESFHIGNGC